MINLGFIGIGGYGKWQLDGFVPYRQAGRVNICALADPSFENLAAAGIEGAELFADYREMLGERADLDAIVISAPIPVHLEIALDALERGLFVLLEKPPVPLLSQLTELIAADTRQRVMVGFQHIYMPLVQRIKEIAWSGEIGRIKSIRAVGIWPRDSAYYQRSRWAGQLFWEGRPTLDGPCTNGMAHFLNSLLFIGGSRPADYARPAWLEGEVYRARPIPGYDLGGVRGVLDTEIAFSAAFSHAGAAALPGQIRVEGTAGSIELIANATKLRDARGHVLEGSDGKVELREAFLDFVEGQPACNLTSLAAMESYVLTTNLMLQSSGGIHGISPDYVTIQNPQTPEAIYSVPGWPEHFADPPHRAAWSREPRSLTPHDFDEQLMLDLLPRPHPSLISL